MSSAFFTLRWFDHLLDSLFSYEPLHLKSHRNRCPRPKCRALSPSIHASLACFVTLHAAKRSQCRKFISLPGCEINWLAAISNGYSRAGTSAPTSELHRDTRRKAVRLSFPHVHANWVLLCSADHEIDLFRICSESQVVENCSASRRCTWLESGVRLSSPKSRP